MPNDSFRFKEFTVRQAQSAMKVGTDGVILGSWANVDFGKRTKISALDVGTGTGLIALMVAQRNPGCRIEGIEIESGAAEESAYNFSQSPFQERMSVVHSDFQSYSLRQAEMGKRYELIVSNPPYFNGTFKSVDAQRTAARHTELLPTEELIAGVLRVIDLEVGRFAAIFPYSDAAIFIAKAAAMGLYCNRLLEIYSKEGKPAKRMAAEFSVHRTSDLLSEQLVIFNSRGEYSEMYRELTSMFYVRL